VDYGRWYWAAAKGTKLTDAELDAITERFRGEPPARVI
jgi:hypothetical protein